MDKKNRILEEAYKQLSAKGIEATRIEDIASALKMSKKTIYLLFRSKEEIVFQTGLWKLESIALKAQKVVEQKTTIVNKLILYIECIYVNLSDVSLPMISNFISKRKKVDTMMNDYIHTAVFDRFHKLFEQAKNEGRLKDNSDPKSSLVMYGETLSTFLLARPMISFPQDFQNDISINKMLSNQLINLFRGFLNDKGIKEFDAEMKKHPVLSKNFA